MCSFIPGKDMLLGGEYLVTPYNNFRHIGLGSVINLGYNYDYLFPDDNQGQEIVMAKFNVGDNAKVLDKPNWPDGGYKIANWQGKIIEVIENPVGYVLMKADKTGYDMLFHEKELEKTDNCI